MLYEQKQIYAIINNFKKHTNIDLTKQNIEILNTDQNHLIFSGERVIINQEVKGKYAKTLNEHMYRYQYACHFMNGATVLDAACGVGYGVKMMGLSGAVQVTGLDISEESIQIARSLYYSANTNFIVGDVTAMPFADESFDTIVSYETIEHIMDGSKFIKESARVLRENGLFIVSTPNRYLTNPGLYFDEQPINPFHCFEYSALEFIGAILKEYNIIEIYGQSFVADQDVDYTLQLRKLRKLDLTALPSSKITVEGHHLVPLSEIKDAQPIFIVALCQKKSR